jgi:phosphatidylserine decarboxylase
MDMLSIVFPRIHREGTRFILAFGAVTLILFWVWDPLGWLGVIATTWCVFFFRDPDRHTPDDENLVICPADGVICSVGPASPPPELELDDEEYMRICVFMNVFDCHVNRSPMDGEVVRTVYHPGKFLNASLDKASEDNERMGLAIRNNHIGLIGVVQIAGLVARRIVCEVKENTILEAGERFGIIRFGSRVDIYINKEIAPLVSVGQTVVAGETVFADIRMKGEGRPSEVR